MNYIILDMEWNQALGRTKMVQSPVMLRGEIIQIGAVKTDEDFNFLDKIKINVCPKYYKIMNRHVEKITGISGTQLMCGEIFPQAFRRLSAWCGDEFRFITWGFDDIGILADNLALHGLDASYGKDYINLQLIFNSQINAERTQWALSDACGQLGIPMDAQAHDAMNDAWFTYEVLKKLDMKKGLADYPKLSSAIRTVLRKDVIQNVPAERGKMMSDPRVRDIPCPDCGAALDARRWVACGGSKKITIASCPEHGDFYVKLTCMRSKSGAYTAVRAVYRSDDDAEASYNKKLEKQLAYFAAKEKKHTEEKNADDGDV